MKKTLGLVFLLLTAFCMTPALSHSYEAKAANEEYEIFDAALKEYYKKEADGYIHLYIDDSGHAEYDLMPVLPENYKYVSQIGPSESGTVQIKISFSYKSGKSYVSLRDNKVVVDYGGNPDDIIGENFRIGYSIESDANFSYEDMMLFMKIDIASARLLGPTRVREGEKAFFELELNGYDKDDITWISSDDTLLHTEENSTGIGAEFIGAGAGSVKVSAVINGKGGIVSLSKPVTVTKKKAGNLNVSKATLYTGESVVLEISNLPKDATVAFSSSASSKVKVEKKTGKITALKKGSATITAKIDVPASEDGKAYSYKLTSKIRVKDGKTTTVTTLKQLESALTNGKGGRYKLGADIKGVTGISVKKGTYRLDLNGHTIYGKSTKSSIIHVAGGNLTITDSDGKGKVINESDQDAAGVEKGTLSIYGGEYIGIVYAVNVKGSGTLNIYGGKISGFAVGLCVQSGNANVFGGTFAQTAEEPNGSVPVDTIKINAYDEKNPAIVTINGGTYTAITGFDVSMNGTSGDITVNGGYFESYSRGVFELIGGKAVINGGEFYYEHTPGKIRGCSLFICTVSDSLSCTINDGIFRNKDDHIIFIQNNPDVFINGGYYVIEKEDKDYLRPVLDILKTFDGTLYLEPGLIDEDRIEDNSTKGKKLIATEFTKNKTKYKKGMLITDPDDLYSAFMDASEDLKPEFLIKCNSDLYKILLHYYNTWNDGFKSTAFSYKESTSTGKRNEKLFDVTLKASYQKEYEIEMVPHSTESKKNASKEAVEYSRKIDRIVSETVKDGMSDREKAVAIHDYMVKNYSYGDKYAPGSHYVWGLLDENKGVCQAYANLYRILCRRAGIECVCIIGVAGEKKNMGLHMWNLLTIDGEELYVDVTFDDTSGTNQWLLKEEKEFYKDGMHFVA